MKIKLKKEATFPAGFLWGAATAAYQVEGGITQNDWAASTRLRPPGSACDHYHRFREDFDLAKKLKHNAHRLSLEWSRLEPLQGVWDESQFNHYLEVLRHLKRLGLTTFVTLHHFTNPLWAAKAGGWANKKIIPHFHEYVSKVCQSFGQYVDYWITINEPGVYTGLCYLEGVWPPFEKNLFKSLRVYRNMLDAHNQAYDIIHYFFPDTQVGFAQNIAYNEPANSKSALDSLAVRFTDWINYKRGFGDTRFDFIGLNYYFHNYVKFSATKLMKLEQRGRNLTDYGWEIFPAGIYNVLMQLKKFKKPIYITENGIADRSDQKRAKFILDHLKYVRRAIAKGADVRGYLYWSLLDNYEWPKSLNQTGYEMKFGLVDVDFVTLKRKIRKSAKVYSEICKTNKL